MVFLPDRARLPARVYQRRGFAHRLRWQALPAGGNLPFFRRLPFVRGKGFTPPYEVEFNEVNLDQLVSSKPTLKLHPNCSRQPAFCGDPAQPGCYSGPARELKTALIVRVHRVTKSAKAKIEAAGGSVELIA